ncbi:MAG: hypothetical protein ACOYD7_06920 [Raoultibacter sp.]|jgi:hypothetical protein
MQLFSYTTTLAHVGDDTGSLVGIIIAVIAVALVALIVALIVRNRRKG